MFYCKSSHLNLIIALIYSIIPFVVYHFNDRDFTYKLHFYNRVLVNGPPNGLIGKAVGSTSLAPEFASRASWV